MLVTVGLILGVRRLPAAWPALLIAVEWRRWQAGPVGLPVETSEPASACSRTPCHCRTGCHFPRQYDGRPAGRSVASRCWGAIESLLSAVVADKHERAAAPVHCELVAQGVANIASTAVRRDPALPGPSRAPRPMSGPPRGGQLPACCTRSSCCCSCSWPPHSRALDPATGAGRRAGGGGLEHGGKVRVLCCWRRHAGDAAVLMATFLSSCSAT